MVNTTITELSAADKLSGITTALASGATVYVATMTRTTEVTAKFAAKWANDLPARPLFKVSGTSLYMSSGRKYLCIDYCAIVISESSFTTHRKVS